VAQTKAQKAPCGWCDKEVIVTDETPGRKDGRGLIVYCSETHRRSNVYVPGTGL
jgi:hypothetical protein